MEMEKQFRNLATVEGQICVSICLPTHRTQPDNLQDVITLKQLCKEAERKLTELYGKRETESIANRLLSLPEKIDPNYNLDGLHIFIADEFEEIIRTSYPVTTPAAMVSDRFLLNDLLKAVNRSAEYLILLLSQSGVHLYRAHNDSIVAEIRNSHFPFSENRFYNTHSDKGSDPAHLDDLVREFLNRVDKAMVEVHHETGLRAIAVCTGDNYSRLMQVADLPAAYIGQIPIDYNHTAAKDLAGKGWELMRQHLKRGRLEALESLGQAVSASRVITDLQEMYQAAQDGRADILFLDEHFSQPVRFTSARTFATLEANSDSSSDISSMIVWQTIRQGGRVVFMDSGELENYQGIAMKTRY